jgi:hypothetical protein
MRYLRGERGCYIVGLLVVVILDLQSIFLLVT